MPSHARFWRSICFWLCIAYSVQGAFAFSLLGPFAPWMGPEVGFIRDPAYDVGGPRNLGDEFRWNVPVVTYGFDDEFKEFFGTNGIAAVEGAVALFNRLPPASEMELTNVPLTTKRVHLTAQAAGVYNLGSAALIYLTEQMGLANSVRFVWVANSVEAPVRTDEEGGINNYVVRRNFDPLTAVPTNFVNFQRYTYSITELAPQFFPMLPETNRIAIEIPVDQAGALPGSITAVLPTVEGVSFQEGEYFSTFTRDELGGIKYLLLTNNVNVEACLRDVRAVGGGNDFVSVAARPGVDKITLQRLDPGGPGITNIFADIYIQDGLWKTQMLQRALVAPDILFTAGHHARRFETPALVERRGPNFSHQNESGSGILQPGVVISFEKLGDIYREPWYSDTDWATDPRWSVFDSRSLTFPIWPDGPEYQGARTLSLRKIELDSEPAIEWKMRLVAGVKYDVERSLDLVNWTFVTNITALPVHTLTNALPANATMTFLRARRISGQ